MIPKLTRSMALSALVAGGFTMMASSASAALVTGTVEWGPYNAYAFVPNSLTYEDGSAYSSYDLLMLCLSANVVNPRSGNTYSWDAGAGAATLRGGGGSLGIAAVNYLVDTFYATYFTSGDWFETYAFQQVLWELGTDFDESSLDSFDPTTGHAKGDLYFPDEATYLAAYDTMFTEIAAILPTLSTDYTSQNYTIDFFEGVDTSGVQNFLVISDGPANPAPSPVPVPAAGLMALGGIAALGALRVRRKKA